MHKEVIGNTEFIYQNADKDEKLMREVYELRYQVYCKECGFIEEKDFPAKAEKDKYDAHSLHYVARDPDLVIGTSRLVLESPEGFPLEEPCSGKLSIDLSAYNRKRVAEISRLAISKQYRRRKRDGLYYTPDYNEPMSQKQEAQEVMRRIKPMAFGLYREMYQDCKRRGITHCVALMEKTLWLLLRMHNFVFRQIGEEVDFYGAVIPYICDIEVAEATMYKRSPNVYNYFLDGLESKYQPNIPQEQKI